MAYISMRYPGGLSKALTLSYDDGVETDIRFMSVIDKYNMKCTFNINTGLFAPEGTVYPKGTVHRRMTKSQAYEAYKNEPHEIAVHAFTHPFLERIPLNITAYEITEDRKNIEEMFGFITRGCAYPYGTYSDEVVEILKNCGIVYARTTKATHSFDIPRDWLRLDPTCHHNDSNLTSLADKFVGDEIKDEANPYFFYLWGHTYEFDGDDNWHVIEDFSAKVGGRDDVWYCTNIEAYDYIRAFNSLEFSNDCTIIHNPSAIDVYLNVKVFGKLHKLCVKSGETVKLK